MLEPQPVDEDGNLEAPNAVGEADLAVAPGAVTFAKTAERTTDSNTHESAEEARGQEELEQDGPRQKAKGSQGASRTGSAWSRAGFAWRGVTFAKRATAASRNTLSSGVQQTVSIMLRNRLMPLVGRTSGSRPSWTLETNGPVSERTMRCNTFEDPTMFRGVPVSSTLHCFGQVYGCSVGTAETFDMSAPTLRLDAFISHNWTTKRIPKFLTLALCYNFRCAVALTALSCVICGTLIAAGVIPTFEPDVHNPYRNDVPVCAVTSYAVFTATLLCGQELLNLLPIKGPVVFLDKVCIHQTNTNLQRKGILCLSAFLTSTKSLFIVYTDTYLQRLWTVYEIASMLVLRAAPKIIVIPTDLAWFVFVNSASFFFLGLGVAVLLFKVTPREDLSLMTGSTEFNLALLVAAYVICFMVIYNFRTWAARRSRIRATVREFTIRRAVCAQEKDREVVEGNIFSIMRDMGFVPKNADEAITLDAFDLLVRELVPQYLIASWGHTGLPYFCAFACGISYVGYSVDVIIAYALSRPPAREFAALVLFQLVHPVAALPLALGIVSMMTKKCRRCTGAREYTIVGSLALLVVTVCISAEFGLYKLYTGAVRSTIVCIVFCMFVMVLLLGTFMIFAPMQVAPDVRLSCKERCREMALASMGGDSGDAVVVATKSDFLSAGRRRPVDGLLEASQELVSSQETGEEEDREEVEEEAAKREAGEKEAAVFFEGEGSSFSL